MVIQEYTPLDGNRSNLVQTAWTMVGLIRAGQVRHQNINTVVSKIILYFFLMLLQGNIAIWMIEYKV
jgi:hypothetical protein